MNGVMVVAEDLADVAAMLAASKPRIVNEWTMADFAELKIPNGEQPVMRGMQAFVKARCNQCHVVAGHGVNLGPNLVESVKKIKGEKLLRQILEPSDEINEKFRTYQFLMDDGRIVSGVIVKDEPTEYHVITNLLIPNAVTRISKESVAEKIASKVSPMPVGLINVLTKGEILDVLAFLEAGGYQLPDHLQHKHHHNPE
jgi:putative heme-binding domain-containing protein